jgi:hypothetical protein
MMLSRWQKNKWENSEKGSKCLLLQRSTSKSDYKCEIFYCAGKNDNNRKEYLNKQLPG